MSKPNASAYGTPAGDTEFRRKRDVDEYAARAKEREAKEREEGKARSEARLAGKRYYKPLEGTETLTSARATTLDLSTFVGKTVIVPAGSGVGRRGRGAGFYCEACDWTVKDSHQWLEHTTSAEHLRNIGQTRQVRRATAADVLARIDAVWARVEADKQAKTIDLAERLALRRQEDEEERERRRTKKRELADKRRAAKEQEAAAVAASRVGYGDDVRIEGEHDEDDMKAMMGITGFGTTKKR